MEYLNPVSGDVVIRRQYEPGLPCLVVGRHRGPGQIATNSYQEAWSRAAQAARQLKVDVWFTRDNVSYERVEHGRSGDA